jgi:hypothetical protein
MKEAAFSQLGAVVTVLLYVSSICVFVLRLAGKAQWGYAVGIFELCLALPLIYLLIKAPGFGRPPLFYVQAALMLVWLAAELLLDYILRLDFRRVRWLLITYVTLFFAASGGMLGVAAHAGMGWAAVSAVLFLTMAVLAFVQRKLTGV